MKNGNKNTIVFGVLLAAALVALFGWQKYNNTTTGGEQRATASTTVPFLDANLPLLQHIHPELKIFVDGAEEAIPANIGLGIRHRAVHTHEEDGVIHVEAQDTRAYTLGDFFSVWGRSIAREGYDVTMTVDGAANEEFEALVLKDKQQIVLNYIKK